MKKVPAIIAAFVVTSMVAIAMLVIGVNAFFNPTSVQAASSPASDTQQAANSSGVPVTGASADTAAQIAQLQQRIQEYQTREQQYQDQLNQAKQQLQQQNTEIQQASSQVQQYQQVLMALQQMGIIQIDSNGQIYLRRSRNSNSNSNSGSLGGGNN
ncbi:MAG TPA: hypothetical protein VF806_06360 [Anaerolineaceae bacterium]